MTSRSPRAFTVCDGDYFTGTVALLNSLHITGNDLPLTVLDLGMTPAQRRLIEPHCDVVAHSADRAPHLCKLLAPVASDDDLVVLIDSDIVVTGALTEASTAAEQGLVYAFPDAALDGRVFAEWTELFGLRAPLRRDVYVNAGFLACSKARGPSLVDRWAQACDDMAAGVLTSSAPEGARVSANPIWYTDQDALNALLMSEVPANRVRVGAAAAMPMQPDALRETKVVDIERLRCEWRGRPVTMLHAIGARKPWQRGAVRELRATAYVRCLRRVLTGPDLVVRIPDDQLVPWLRPDLAGTSTRQVLHAYDLVARWTRPARHRMRTRLRNVTS